MMAAAKKPRIHLTPEQWRFVDQKAEEFRSSGKTTQKDIMDCVSQELRFHKDQNFKVDISGEKLLANYYNRRLAKKKHGKTLVADDPNDIRYILLVYGPSGAHKPTFHCDKMHVQRKVEEETTANGGVPPKMKIFTPITFKVNIEEVHGE